MDPPQRNGDDVLSDRRELVGCSFKSVEFLFSACGDKGSTKFKKCNSNKRIPADSFFKPTDKIVSSVRHKTYSCTNYEKSDITCNSSNIMYLITCSNCFMQYLGKTVQQLNISDINEIRTHNHVVRKQSLNHLATKLEYYLKPSRRTIIFHSWTGILSNLPAQSSKPRPPHHTPTSS